MSDEADSPELSLDAFYDALESVGRPVVTAGRLAGVLDWTQAEASDALDRLAEEDHGVERVDVSNDPVVWFPTDWAKTTERERVVVFPEHREVVVDQPTQFTRAQLAQFATLTDTTGENAYRYTVRAEDVWGAPHDDLAALRRTVRQALGERYPSLEQFVADQWRRARQFRLYTHEEGYIVLEANTPEMMGNVAEQHLSEGTIRAPISDTEAWVAAEAVATVKRELYEAGYPVQDDRTLDEGAELDVELHLSLRDYQRGWVKRFVESGSGVLVGPPGSGKTVAALGVLERIGRETLILAPGRELVAQWRDSILEYTSLTQADVAEYHGGVKEIGPVTIATYSTAGMERHRRLFDEKRWGLVVYDEAHHIPSDVFRRTTDLQASARLGLSATPVRGDDRETDIYTLIGPPIGTDWEALFDAGFVQEPEVEIRFVPWAEDERRYEYASADGHERRMLAASNPAKIDEVRSILDEHPEAKTLVFVDYLDQGDRLGEALSLPFVSGDTPHSRRERLFHEFRAGERDVLLVSRVADEGIDLPDAELAIIASGLGGSRRQGAQRAGRTMRPAGRALVYVLATRGTEEEDFARNQTRHLAEKGARVREADAEAFAGPSDSEGPQNVERE
ncbi:helicase [Halarchaeum grantii]|uniref:Putative DNA 3'-5' helicase Rad25 n=1 Tax=Halarchaeum grantii TaxID=1193105 RepID=A0A830F5L4_9EURY|nr:DEAD/DEAH box helicase [Halarchaeum grantii]GGL22980.1 helicase [Halarchaeum grantii]